MKGQKSLEPKLKLSLDKLLNRLQKCEKTDSVEKVSVGCSHENPQVKNEKSKDKSRMKIDKVLIRPFKLQFCFKGRCNHWKQIYSVKS